MRELAILPWERLVRVECSPIKAIKNILSAKEALMKLTGATTEDQIGQNGPSIGALPSAENADISSLNIFKTYFGRNSLISALDVRDVYPRLLRATLLFHASNQGVKYSKYAEEEPGRTFHEYSKENPEAPGNWEYPYYGDVSGPVIFVNAFCTQASVEGVGFFHERYLGRDHRDHTMEHSFLSALGWIMTRLRGNEEVLLEHKPWFEGSLENQVWKDSWDAYHHDNGSIANHKQGVASIEVQALLYDALLRSANTVCQLARIKRHKLRYEHMSRELRHEAAHLQAQIMRFFWTKDQRGGYFVLGTDRDDQGGLRQLKVRTSNMGHLLDSEVLAGDSAETEQKRTALVQALFSEEMMAPAGIRTLSNREKRFGSGRYHCGSVWPWDNYRISVGLERHGYLAEAEFLQGRILNIVRETKKFPEFVRGGGEGEPFESRRTVDVWDHENKRRNRIEQPAQEIVDWTVSSVVAIEHKNRQRMVRRTEA